MKNTIQSLREYQSQVDLSKLEKSIYISIDRLTVIFDSENQSLRRIFRELRKSLDNIIQEFSIQENLREDYFTLYKTINEDSINLIFFQLSDYGGYQVIRLDFNPNSLKEFEGLQVWRQIMNYARLNRLEIRLSRLDHAFDIFNRPEIVFLQHIKGTEETRDAVLVIEAIHPSQKERALEAMDALNQLIQTYFGVTGQVTHLTAQNPSVDI